MSVPDLRVQGFRGLGLRSEGLQFRVKASPESVSYLPKSNTDLCLICWELYDVFGSRPSSD